MKLSEKINNGMNVKICCGLWSENIHRVLEN